jgi:isoquinoline 1-oxidoreductase alpha subunit
MASTAFTINGKTASVEAEPDTPLLWVVREHLQLTGTKFGCGSGLCGACTVHIDGKAVRSCQISVSKVAGRKVTTIEGLSPNGQHPLQKAWVAEQVPQCGYCQSGQIMQAAALLATTRNRRANRSSRIWTATSAVAAPIHASCVPFNAPLGRPKP